MRVGRGGSSRSSSQSTAEGNVHPSSLSQAVVSGYLHQVTRERGGQACCLTAELSECIPWRETRWWEELMGAPSRHTPLCEGGFWGGDSSLLRTLEAKQEKGPVTLDPVAKWSAHILRKKGRTCRMKGTDRTGLGFFWRPHLSSRISDFSNCNSVLGSTLSPFGRQLWNKCQQHPPQDCQAGDLSCQIARGLTCAHFPSPPLCFTAAGSLATHTVLTCTDTFFCQGMGPCYYLFWQSLPHIFRIKEGSDSRQITRVSSYLESI